MAINSIEKTVIYATVNTYETLNELTKKTKNVWLVCHGIGYLSRYFLRYFNTLNSEENYIIAPQAPSKYYLGSKYRHVGASWLTKENTTLETENILRYLDQVLIHESIPNHVNLLVLGYSQGVSVASRFVASRQLKCSQLVLLSGKIPKELNSDNFKFLKGKAKVFLIYGTEDAYFNEKVMQVEQQKFIELFGDNAQIIPFKGGHEVNIEILKKLV